MVLCTMMLKTTIQATLHNLTPEAEVALAETARIFQSACRTAYQRLKEGQERSQLLPANKALSGLAADLRPAASLGRPLCAGGGFRRPPSAGGYSPPCTPRSVTYHAIERRGFPAHEMKG